MMKGQAGGAGVQAVKAQMRASVRRPPSAFGCPRPMSDYARAFIKVRGVKIMKFI